MQAWIDAFQKVASDIFTLDVLIGALVYVIVMSLLGFVFDKLKKQKR